MSEPAESLEPVKAADKNEKMERIESAAFQQIWDYFFLAETGTYEKSLWLDIILSEILVRTKDGAYADSIEAVCPTDSTVTLIACELLCGIHRTTSSPVYDHGVKCSDSHEESQSSDPWETLRHRVRQNSTTTDSFSPISKNDKLLADYALKGTGWRCIAVLEKLDLKGLSCHRQLGKILMWLFDEINKKVTESTQINPYLFDLYKKPPIYEMLCPKTELPELDSKYSNLQRKNKRIKRFSKYPKAQNSQIGKKRRNLHSKISSHNQSSDSELIDDLKSINHTFKLKTRFNLNSMRYGTAVLKTSTQATTKIGNIPKKKILPSDYIVDELKDILKSEISQGEFNTLVLNLLYKLCIIETETSETDALPINIQCVNFAMKHLCSVQHDQKHETNNSSHSLSLLKKSFIELLMISIDKLLKCENPFFGIVNQDIFHLSLNLLENVGCLDKSDLKNPPEYIFGVCYTALVLLFSLLIQKCTIENLKQFKEMFQLLSKSEKRCSIQNCFRLIMNDNMTEVKIRKLLLRKISNLLGVFITAMKKIRYEAIHIETCPKDSHEICLSKSNIFAYHHKNILGPHFLFEAEEDVCSVSFFYNIMISFLDLSFKQQDTTVTISIMKSMQKCGACCCFPPEYLIQKIIPIAKSEHPHITNLCFAILERTLYGEIGFVQSNNSQCEKCKNASIMNENMIRNDFDETCSRFYKISWDFLKVYRMLFDESDPSLIHASAVHFSRVIAICNMNVKHDVLFCVLYPLFENAKAQFFLTKSETSHQIIKMCLRLFTHYLCNSVFVEEFTQKDGLKNIMELMSSSELTKYYCSVLEIIIKCEIHKIKNDLNSAESTIRMKLQSLLSLELLISLVKNFIENCIRSLKKEFSSDVFFKMIDLSQYFDTMKIGKNNILNTKYLIERQNDFTCQSSNQNNVIEGFSIQTESHSSLEFVKNLSIYLNICASLCICCPLFRKYLRSQDVFQDFFILTKFIMNSLYSERSLEVEIKLYIEVLEALLTIGFSMADCTTNDSKKLISQIMVDVISAGRGIEMECSDIKDLIDVLLRVSYVSISEENVSPQDLKTKLSYLNLNIAESEDLSSDNEEDETTLPHYASEESELYHTADEGYEADEENSALKISKMSVDDQLIVKKLQHVPKKRYNSYNELEMLSQKLNKYKQYNPMMFPELCRMAIDLLLRATQRLLTMLECSNYDTCDSSNSLNIMICSGFDQILSLLSIDTNYSSGNGIINQILSNPAMKIFQTKKNQLKNIQESVMNLIYILATRNITSYEFKMYLSLLTHSNIPLKILLQPLIKLSGNIQENIPDFILRFPMEKLDLNDQKIFNMSNPKGRQFLLSIQSQHEKFGIKSCWTTAGISCNFEEVDFNIWDEGFSFSMWLQIQNNQPSTKMKDLHRLYGDFRSEIHSNQSNKYQNKSRENLIKSGITTSNYQHLTDLHLLSIGNDSSNIEFWVDFKTGDLIVKIVHPSANNTKIIGEGKIESCFLLFKWNHMAVNVQEFIQKRTAHIKISVFINEQEERTILIPLIIPPIQKTKPNYFLIGHLLNHQNDQVAGCWYFSGLTLFRTPMLTRNIALFMTANGPNKSVLSLCKIPSNELNIATLFTNFISLSEINWDEVYDSVFMGLEEFQKNAILSYFAHSPSVMQLYNNSITNITGKNKKIVFPQFMPNILRGSVLLSQHKGLGPAVYLTGGPLLLLYLFARVVELDGNSDEQAQALSILFNVSFSDSRLYSMFYNDEVLSMLHFVFLSPKCNLSLYTVKAMLDVACSSSIVININNKFHILSKSNAVIKHPNILTLMLENWKQFECAKNTNSSKNEIGIEKKSTQNSNKKEQNIAFKINNPNKCHDLLLNNYDLLESLFLSIEVLIRDSHPYRSFNIYQLNRVNMVDLLLSFCKERFLNTDMDRLSTITSCSLIELIRSLIGFPPQINHMIQLVNFLILMHKASETFVTHSRSNFYFLVWPTKTIHHKSIIPNILGLQMSFSSKRRYKKKMRIKKQNAIVKFLSRVEHPSPTDNISFGGPITERSSKSSTKDDSEKSISPRTTSVEYRKRKNYEVKYGRLNKLKRKRSLKTGKKRPKRLKSLRKSEKKSACSRRSSNVMKDYVVIEPEDIVNQSSNKANNLIEQQQITFKNLRSGSLHSWTICKGLLNLLKEISYIMPDILFRQVLGDILRSEALLILANHEDASVRTHLLNVIYVLIQRSSKADYKKFEESLFFYHLANQISQYPASFELVVACSSLITGSQASLKDQLEEEVWNDVSDSSILRSPPLLSLLRSTLNDTTLLKNIIVLLKKVVAKGSLKVLNEICMGEGIIKCLLLVGMLEEPTATCDTILENLRSLLSDVVLKFISSQQTTRNAEDIYFQLSCLERDYRTRSTEIKSNTISKLMRDTQCYLMNAELDYVENKIKEVNLNIGCAVFNTNPVKKPNVIQSIQLKKTISSELQSHFSQVISNATTFFLCREINIQISSIEQKFIKRLFSKLIHLTLQEKKDVKWWNADNDWLFTLNKMFKWIISPIFTSITIQISVLKSLRDFPHIKRLLTPSDLLSQRKIAVYLKTLIEKLAKENYVDLLTKEMVIEWICTLQLEQHIKSEALLEEANHLAVLDINEYVKLEIDHYPNNKNTVHKKEWLAKKLIESAMATTRVIVEIQNGERKKFINHLRQQQSRLTDSALKWHKLIEQYSHEKGPWYFESLYPNSWEIDSTEGPDRIRVRLKRCHLNIAKKFLIDQKKKTYAPIPLSFLFENFDSNLQNNLLQKLHLHESIHFMIRAIYVSVKYDQSGELLLSDRYLHFMADSKKSEDSSKDILWALDSIIMMVTRRWQLRERAIEIFLSSGHAELIAFETADDMKSFLSIIKCHLTNCISPESVTDIINRWRNGEMTNWKYLMQLNGLAGRTYNDLMQYPVIPFILADYTSDVLNLNEIRSFRDLMKPMAIQNKHNEKHYIDNYNHLKEARNEGTCLLNANKEPFHYGSHYSNSGTVLHFLVRLSPFTSLFLNYQDNNFDIPDRTFHSLQTTWRLASCDSTTDVKELIPEFFYLPQFLSNSEDLNFGIRQCGEPVDNILLPPWAKNPRLFILIHRQVLEGKYVKENLPNWIDLVFGYKQTGQAAIDAVNVFHPATYYGFDVNAISDELERDAWETMIKTYGQTPRQLFKQPHPHCITDLTHFADTTIEVLPSVIGLRWGTYCGSPQEPAPVIIIQRHFSVPAMKLLSLNNNEVIGLPVNTTLLVSHSIKSRDIAVTQNTINHVDLITWNYPDGIMRIKQHKDSPLEPLFSVDNLDSLKVVSHGTENNSHTLWLGLQSGRIIVLSYQFISQNSTKFLKKPTYLYGHYESVVAINICDAFGVAASASIDGSIILWDINSLTYVRLVVNPYQTVSDVYISETLCDIATVHLFEVKKKKGSAEMLNEGRTYETDRNKIRSSYSSKVRVQTVNGSLVGEIKLTEKVTSICYSHATEGVSVNSILIGLHSGSIRFFSSWDLKPLLCLTPSTNVFPIISIVYSRDSQYLYSATSDGTIMIWGSSIKSGSNPNFRMLTTYPVF